MKNYLIVGSNNFWYSYLETDDLKDVEKDIREVINGIENNDYEFKGKPDNLRIFEVKQIQTIDL